MAKYKAAVEAIVGNLRDRRGLRQAWEGIDLDIQQEIMVTWEQLLESILDAGLLVAKMEMTCSACPAQWEGEATDGKEIYVRYRYGTLRVDVANKTVYESRPGDAFDGWMVRSEMIEYTKGALDFSECKWEVDDG